MQSWRQTELLEMLGVTIIGSHSYVGSQALGEVYHCLVDVFLWQLFRDGLQATFNSSVVLSFGCSLWCFSNMAPQT